MFKWCHVCMCVFLGTLFERTLLNSGAVLVLCCRPRSLHQLSLPPASTHPPISLLLIPHPPTKATGSFISPQLTEEWRMWVVCVCVCVCPQKVNNCRNTKISLAAFDLSPCVGLSFIVWLARLVYISCLNTRTRDDCSWCYLSRGRSVLPLVSFSWW